VNRRAALSSMSEFRKDPVTGRWVIIASARAQRPRHMSENNESAQIEPCPFCPGHEAMTPPEVWSYRETNTQPDTPGWRVRVVSNKYPALAIGGTWSPRNDGVYESRHGLGVHEVIIESPDHVVNMDMLSADQFTNILRAYSDRMRQHHNDRRWRYLLVYKNQGALAGATLEHVHSQLVVLPAVPRQAVDELNGAKKYYRSTGRCIYCEMIEHELERRERVIATQGEFVALCPFAPRFAYETWIAPINHFAAFEQSSEQDIATLAHVLKDTITRLNRALENPPFNYLIHSIPPHEKNNHHYHWHIEILPQLARAAGFEWGSGSHMNSVAPEDAARSLRDAL
jgi:UDPglucose--hexose-1-phosphate uridylyltransferase